MTRNTICRWELGQWKPTGSSVPARLRSTGLVDAPVLPQALRELEERVAALECWRQGLDQRSGRGRS